MPQLRFHRFHGDGGSSLSLSLSFSLSLSNFRAKMHFVNDPSSPWLHARCMLRPDCRKPSNTFIHSIHSLASSLALLFFRLQKPLQPEPIATNLEPDATNITYHQILLHCRSRLPPDQSRTTSFLGTLTRFGTRLGLLNDRRLAPRRNTSMS